MKKLVVLAMALSVSAWAQVKPGAGTPNGIPTTPESRTPAVVESNRATPPAPTAPATSPPRRPRTAPTSTGSTTLANPTPPRKDALAPRCAVLEVFTRPLVWMQEIPTAGLEISDYSGKTTFLIEYAFGQVPSAEVLGYPEDYFVHSWMIGGRWYAQPCAEGRFASVRLRARTYTLPSQLDQIDGMYNVSLLGGYKKKISPHFYFTAEIGLCLTSVEAFTYFDKDSQWYRNPAGIGIPSALGLSFRF